MPPPLSLQKKRTLLYIALYLIVCYCITVHDDQARGMLIVVVVVLDVVTSVTASVGPYRSVLALLEEWQRRLPCALPMWSLLNSRILPALSPSERITSS